MCALSLFYPFLLFLDFVAIDSSKKSLQNNDAEMKKKVNESDSFFCAFTAVTLIDRTNVGISENCSDSLILFLVCLPSSVS